MNVKKIYSLCNNCTNHPNKLLSQSFIKELNTPRYMSVSGLMECCAKPYSVWDYETLKESKWVGPVENVGLKGSPTQVYKSFSPR